MLGAWAPQETITLEDFKTSITKQGLALKEVKLPEQNIFIREVNGVSPNIYYLGGTTLSIYVFPSEKDREEGLKAFKKSIVTASLEPYKTYTVQNVLIFYVEGKKGINNKLVTAIHGLD